MPKKLNTKKFIERAIKVHGDKYDYSKVEYVNSHSKVCIICPIHGEFLQIPNDHLSGSECPKCGKVKQINSRKDSKEEFIEKAIKTHDNKYDYSKVKYVNSLTKVCIICHDKDKNGVEHGEFWQTPQGHLRGRGCKKCRNLKISLSRSLGVENFISKSKKIHGNKYDYSKVIYKNNLSKIKIICPIHGEFLQIPNDHLKGCGCPYCSNVGRINTNMFIKRSIKIHGNRYDYSKVEYNGYDSKVCIICHKHGEFWQTPHDHLNGCGCPKCNSSKLEKRIRNYLSESKISFTEQKKFKWLNKQSLDFYLPQYNIGIECQGVQHFKTIDFFGGEKGFKDCARRDALKKQLCEKNGVKLLYYTNIKKYIDNLTIFDEKNLLIKILEHGKTEN